MSDMGIIKPLRQRIADLEEINEAHQKKNGQLRVEIQGKNKKIEELEEQINSANDPILMHDNGEVYKIPKDTMVEWVKSSGGGENAADTAMITTDKDGNLLYDGWSDKKTLNDIQGNSTLNDDFNKAAGRVDKLLEGGRIDSNTREKAVKISNKKIDKFEKEFEKIWGTKLNLQRLDASDFMKKVRD